MYILGYYEFKCFLHPSSVFCVLHFFDNGTAAIENIRNMRAISTNKIAAILPFNDKYNNAIINTVFSLISARPQISASF